MAAIMGYDAQDRLNPMHAKHKVLMILTHDRLDCLRLCLDMLEKAGAYSCFDRVVLLLNGVPPRLRRFVEAYMAARPQVKWDAVDGDGTRPGGICFVQNECIRRYPDSVYVKIDEDVFVPRGWAERMLETYERFAGRDDLALIAPLIPNNAYGLHRLLTAFHPDMNDEHVRRFGMEPSTEIHGPLWSNYKISEWATRSFLDLEQANRRQASRPDLEAGRRWFEFRDRFSIGCICYDHAHVRRMGGRLPPHDEPEWCAWIVDHGQTCVLDQSVIVHHYSFFVQQEWLDRTSLLEDLRVANLPDTIRVRSWSQYHGPRWVRVARQLPAIVKRRMGAQA